jgi:ADP-heptose:LPS heptosyltransferase
VFYVLLALLTLPFLQRRSSGEIRSILVVQTGKIGDFICSTPLFRELRAAFPEARIVLALHPVNIGLARQLPYFDQFLEIPSGALSGWQHKWQWVKLIRQMRPDVALCCSGGTAWPFILAMSGIPQRLGVTPNFLGRSTRFAQRLWTGAVAHDGKQLIGTTYARLLALLGVTVADPRKELRAAEAAGEKVSVFLAGRGGDTHRLAGLAISSANKLKELGLPMLLGVCRRLLEADPDLAIVLLGGPGDRPLAAELGTELGSSRLIDSCGVFALDEVPALLQRLSVFIGVDSGLTYMADTLSIPLVSLAGPCNMQETRPLNEHVIILQEKLPCVPCAHIFKAPYSCHVGTRACIKNVRADSIADAALGLLAVRHSREGSD